MRKLIFLLLLFPIIVFPGTISQSTVYTTGSEVTATNLNNNFADSINEINGNLDNSNADTAGGFRFVEVKGSLPTVGTQGRVVFLTTDDTLYFDDGTSWNPVVVTADSPVHGNIIFRNGTAWRVLAPSTANLPLVTNGADNDPAFEQIVNSAIADDTIDLAAKVTGTLPVGNGGTGATADANAASGVAVLGADGYLADDLVDTSALKTTTGEVSHTGSTYSTETLPGGTYGFYPQTKMGSTGSHIWGASLIVDGTSGGDNAQSGWTTYATALSFLLTTTTETIYAKQRYVTASGVDHWIFLLIDKSTKELLSAWQAPDHVSYGNGGDPEKLPHPFNDYDATKHEIILLDKETCNQLKQESKDTGRSILTLVNEEYKPNMTKTEVYQPLHSGKFLGQAPVLIETIPDYIKVRKLTKLNQAEKDAKEAKREAGRLAYEAKKLKKENDKKEAVKKLKDLGLTKDEINTIIN